MKAISLVNKALKAVKEEGIQGCAQKTKGYIENQKKTLCNYLLSGHIF